MAGSKIGFNIGILRENRSQEEIGAAIGVSREKIKHWENGTRSIKAEDIIKLAEYFGVSSDYLLGLSDIRTPSPDLRGACEYTGLSEHEVEIIRKINGKKRENGLHILLNSLTLESLSESIIAFSERCRSILSGEYSRKGPLSSQQISRFSEKYPDARILQGYDLIEFERRELISEFEGIILFEAKYFEALGKMREEVHNGNDSEENE